MSTETTLPHCPRCGGELVHKHAVGKWYVRCAGCDFHNRDDVDNPAWDDRSEALYAARRLIRAELARQALELRAHSMSRPTRYDECGHWDDGAHSPETAIYLAMDHYRHLGLNPIRLPGEDA